MSPPSSSLVLTSGINRDSDASRKTHLSLRAVLFGIGLGALICFANTTFALQSGFTYSMTLPSGLLSFGVFKLLRHRIASPFTIEENALVIAVASSFGTMPLTIGTSGIVPGLEFLTTPEQGGPFRFTTWELLIWAAGLSLIGVIIAPPLRNYFVFKEKLRFPAGTSAAILLGLLHKNDRVKNNMKITDVAMADSKINIGEGDENALTHGDNVEVVPDVEPDESDVEWRYNIKCITWAFSYASTYGLVSYFVPIIERIPLFGKYFESEWAWSFHTSPSYLAMGMLVHTSTSLWMTVGTIIGWGILGPISKTRGWAKGPTRDWETGAQGWILWVALGAILGDTLVYVIIIYGRALFKSSKQLAELLRSSDNQQAWTRWWQEIWEKCTQGTIDEEVSRRETQPLLSSQLDITPGAAGKQKAEDLALGYRQLIFWIVLSTILSLTAMSVLFRTLLSPGYILLDLLLVLPFSLVCIRAFGEVGNAATDTVGRIAQFIFALIIPKSTPGAILSNMALASVSEAGGWQSAELMSELKMGYLTGVSATDMLYAQIIGSTLGGITASFIYRLYTKVYVIPSDNLPAPHAHMVYSSAMIMYGDGLPEGVAPFALCAMVGAALVTSMKVLGNLRWTRYLPQALPIAIGMYIKPEFTLTRSIGGLVRWYIVDYQCWKELPLVSVCTGLILGESILSIVKFGLRGFGVPHL